VGASNRELDAAWAYHNGTKHSFWSIRHNAHFLDSSIKPLQFKIYTDLPPVELPREVPPLEMPALASIALSGDEPAGAAVPDLRALVQVLYYSAGITKHKKYPGGEILFRAASCTGALYEIELYVVCGDLEDLSAGVYHFNPGDLALRRLRTGDFRRLITSATGEEPATAEAPALIVCSGTYWRNSWKYQSRTYRHFGWDNGTLLGNLLATAAALGLPARVVMGFVDEPVNDLLALDTTREVSFSIVALGAGSPLQSEPPAIKPLALRTIPLSTREVDYPAMREMHAASSLITTDEARQWRGHTPISEPPSAGELIPLRPADDEFAPSDGLGAVIMRRGSTRRFDRKKTLSFEQFSILLDRSLR
jgi:SagB-type dehydrogenase family enzyme